MTIDKSADLKKRGVILETCEYPSLKTDTIVKSHQFSLCIIEQKGKEVSRTKEMWHRHGTLFHLNKEEFHLKKSLFGGFKKVAFNFINVQSYTTHTKKTTKSKNGWTFNIEVDVTYKIKNVNMAEWNAWAKKTKFEKHGTVWLTAAGWENLIVNLFVQKGFDALCADRTNVSHLNGWISPEELNAIAGFVVNQCKRFGFTIECSIKHNCKK